MDVQCYIGPGWVEPPCAEMGALGGGPMPSMLIGDPVPRMPWDAQWRGGRRGEGEGRVPDWPKDALWSWGQCSWQVEQGVLPEGARRWGGRNGAPLGIGFLVLLSSAVGWGRGKCCV